MLSNVTRPPYFSGRYPLYDNVLNRQHESADIFGMAVFPNSCRVRVPAVPGSCSWPKYIDIGFCHRPVAQ